MLRLAGCSSGTGVCARGGCSAGRGGALAAFRGRCAFRGSVRNAGPVLPHGEAVARRHFALRSSVYRRLGGVARSYRNVARSSQACRAFPSECRAFLLRRFAFDHACCLPPERQTGRLAICCVPIPPWVVIAIRAFSNRRCGYRAFLVHFGRARFLAAIPTGARGDGERSRRRGVGASLRDHIGFVMLSAGSPLGLRAPNLRQRVFDSLDSLHLIRGVGAFHAAMGTRVQRRPARVQ